MKYRFALIALGGAVAFTAAIASSKTFFNNVNNIKADPSYYLELTSENVSSDSSFVVTNERGNKFVFEGSGVSVADGKIIISAGGYIKNAYGSEIRGIATVNPVFTGTVSFDYTWGNSLAVESPYYQRRDIHLIKPEAEKESGMFSFLDEKPNYVKINNPSSSDSITLDKITINYSCEKTPEQGDNLILSDATMFERFKTIVNWGSSFEGQTVELGDDIDMSGTTTAPIGNSVYPFRGTFDGKNHTISNLTLSGVDQIAPFGNVVGGTIKNVKFSNLSITGTSQRAAGVAGRSSDGTFENVHVLSGTIQGTTQNGGIVGVSVAGSDRTSIICCSNAASVTGTTGGGNGGLLGYNFSGKSFVYDSVNTGNVTSTGSKTTGGIVGSTATSNASVVIELCELGKDTVVQNANPATSARATCGYIIGSADTTVVTVTGSGVVTDLISSVSEYDSFKASCSSSPNYQYKVAKLTADLDFNSETTHMLTTFSGLLDGDGHTMSNFKATGASQIALIGNCLRGGVKNLKMANVDIEATTQRAAAIAGRSESASYKNIEVLSGTINGVKESGGLVGASVIGKTTIRNCINKANVVGIYKDGVDGSGGSIGGLVGTVTSVSSAEALDIIDSVNEGSVSSTASSVGKAGILGYLKIISGATSINIVGCENKGSVSGGGEYTAGVFGGWATKPGNTSYILHMTIKNTVNSGSISGTGNGCGGIVGATNSVQDYLVIKILDCTNRGNISGAAYVGGISGLIRNDSTTNESLIDNCKNFGNITSTGTGCGGISGTGRINITNCACYKDATLKAGSTTKLASQASATGAPGYIALNYEKGCPVHTGNHLCDADGAQV